jgi:hypothetical protein
MSVSKFADFSIKIIRISIICFFCLSFGQTKKTTVETIFDNVEKKYNDQKNYSYNINYKFYNDSKKTKPTESYQSTIIKLNGVQYQKLQNVELFDFGDKNVMIEHSEKIIQVSSIENKNYPVLIKAYLKIFSKNKVVEEKDRYVCTLYDEKLNQTNIKSIKIYVSKKDYSLLKQELYFFGENEKSIPKLEVSFITRKIDVKKDSELLKKSNYYKVVNGKIKSSEKYKDYRLVVH